MGRLFWKLFFAFWLALITASLGVGGIVWLYHSDPPGEIRMQRLKPTPSVLRTGTAVLQFGGLEALRNMLEETQKDSRSSLLYALDENGIDILQRSISDALITEAIQQADNEISGNSARRIKLDDNTQLLLFVPNESTRQAPPLPSIGGPPPGNRFFGPPMWLRNPPLWLLSVIGLAVSILFSALLAWYLASPVRHLRRVFSAAEAGDLEMRAQPLIGQRRDEIADLGRAYDKMADKIKELINAQKRLFHDVSHELRSPLARIQAATGLARQNPEKVDIALERIELEIERVDTLVGEILVLARLESGVVGDKGERIDLIELVEEVIIDSNFEAEANGCRIEFSGANGQALLNGRIEMLARAFNNVIGNAIKYTLPGSVITVNTQLDQKSACFKMEVTDQGKGVPENELSSIFEAFYRSSQIHGRGGYGLGLAIARRTIETYGGSIKAKNAATGSLCVIITLPIIV